MYQVTSISGPSTCYLQFYKCSSRERMKNLFCGVILLLSFSVSALEPAQCKDGQYFCLQASKCVDAVTERCDGPPTNPGFRTPGFPAPRPPVLRAPIRRGGSDECGPDEVYCLQTQRCIPSDMTDDGDENSERDCSRRSQGPPPPPPGSPNAHFRPAKPTTCPPGTVFCLMSEKCVKADGTPICNHQQNGGSGPNRGNLNGGTTGGNRQQDDGAESSWWTRNGWRSQNQNGGTASQSGAATNGKPGRCQGKDQYYCQLSYFRPNEILANGDDQILLLLAIAGRDGYNPGALGGMKVGQVMRLIGFNGKKDAFNRLLQNMFTQAQLLFCLVPRDSGGCVKRIARLQRDTTGNVPHVIQYDEEITALLEGTCDWTNSSCLQSLDRYYATQTQKSFDEVSKKVLRSVFEKLTDSMEPSEQLGSDFRSVVDNEFIQARKKKNQDNSAADGGQNPGSSNRVQRPGSGSGQRPGSGSGQKPGSGSGQRPGSGSGERPGSGSGERPGSGSGQRPGSGSGQRPGSGSGQRPGSGSGQRPGSGSGQRPGSGSGSGQKPDSGSGQSQRPGSGSGQRPGSGSGSGQKPDSGSGQRPGSGSGQKPGSGSGERPGSGSGERPGSGSGQRPGSGSGQRPGSGSGERPGSGSGERPGSGSGQRPGSGSGQRPGSGSGERPGSGSGQRPGSGSGQRPGSGSGQRPGSGSGQRPGSGSNGGQGSGSSSNGGQRPGSGSNEGQRPGSSSNRGQGSGFSSNEGQRRVSRSSSSSNGGQGSGSSSNGGQRNGSSSDRGQNSGARSNGGQSSGSGRNSEKQASGTTGNNAHTTSRTSSGWGRTRRTRRASPVVPSKLRLDQLAQRPGLVFCTMKIQGNSPAQIQVKRQNSWKRYIEGRKIDGSEMFRVALMGDWKRVKMVNIQMTCSFGYCQSYTKLVKVAVQPTMDTVNPTDAFGLIPGLMTTDQDTEKELGPLHGLGNLMTPRTNNNNTVPGMVKLCMNMKTQRQQMDTQCNKAVELTCKAFKSSYVYVERRNWIKKAADVTDEIQRKCDRKWKGGGNGCMAQLTTPMRFSPKKGFTGTSVYRIRGVKRDKACLSLFNPCACISEKAKLEAEKNGCFIGNWEMKFKVKDRRDRPLMHAKAAKLGRCMNPAPYNISQYEGETGRAIARRLYYSPDKREMTVCVLSQSAPEYIGFWQLKLPGKDWKALQTEVNGKMGALHPNTWKRIVNLAKGCKLRKQKSRCNALKYLVTKYKSLYINLQAYCLPPNARIRFKYERKYLTKPPNNKNATKIKIMLTASDSSVYGNISLNVSRIINHMAGQGNKTDVPKELSLHVCFSNQVRYGCDGKHLNLQRTCQAKVKVSSIRKDICNNTYNVSKGEKPCMLCGCKCDKSKYSLRTCDGVPACLLKTTTKCPTRQACDGVDLTTVTINSCGYCVGSSTKRPQNYGMHCGKCVDDPEDTESRCANCALQKDGCGRCLWPKSKRWNQGCVSSSGLAPLSSPSSFILNGVFSTVEEMKIVCPKNIEIPVDISTAEALKKSGSFKYPISLTGLDLSATAIRCELKMKLAGGKLKTISRMTFYGTLKADEKKHKDKLTVVAGRIRSVYYSLSLPSSIRTYLFKKSWTVAYSCSGSGPNSCPVGKPKNIPSKNGLEPKCYCLVPSRYISSLRNAEVRLKLASVRSKFNTPGTYDLRLLYAPPKYLEDITDAPGVSVTITADTPTVGQNLKISGSACQMTVYFSKPVTLNNKTECQRKHLWRSSRKTEARGDCCYKLFSDTRALGPDAECEINRRRINIILGKSATLAAGMKLTVRPRALKQQGSISSGYVTGSASLPGMALKNLTLKARVHGPSEVSVCQPLKLRANSFGAVGCGSIVNYRWSGAVVSCKGGVNMGKASSMLERALGGVNSEVRTSATLNLGNSSMEAGCSFNFSLTVSNPRLGAVAKTYRLIKKTSTPSFNVRLRCPSRTTPSQGLDIQGRILYSKCGRPKGEVVITWSISPLHCDAVFAARTRRLVVKGGEDCDLRGLQNYEPEITVTHINGEEEITKSAKCKIRTGLDPLIVNEEEMPEMLPMTAVDIAPLVMKVEDPGNMEEEPKALWTVNKCEEKDNDGDNCSAPVQTVKEGKPEYVATKGLLVPKTDNGVRAYQLQPDREDFEAGKQYEACLEVERMNQTTSKCSKFVATAEEAPIVTVTGGIVGAGDRVIMTITGVMCYSGNLTGTLVIGEKEAPEPGCKQTQRTVTKDADQKCMTVKLVCSNVTTGAAYDATMTASVLDTEGVDPDVESVSKKLTYTVPDSPTVTECKPSCTTTCMPLRLFTVSITATDVSESLEYTADVVCAVGEETRTLTLFGPSLEDDVDTRLPISTRGRKCHIVCHATNEHRLRTSLQSGPINVMGVQTGNMSQIVKNVRQMIDEPDEDVPIETMADAMPVVTEEEKDKFVDAMVDKIKEAAEVAKKLPKQLAEATLKGVNKVIEAAKEWKNGTNDVKERIKESTQTATAAVMEKYSVWKTKLSEKMKGKFGKSAKRKRRAVNIFAGIPAISDIQIPTMTSSQAENILQGHLNSMDGEITSAAAQKFLSNLQEVMTPALAQGITLGSPAIEVVTELVSVNVIWPNFTNMADVPLNVSCVKCSDASKPCNKCPQNVTATLKLGRTVLSAYEKWTCKEGFQCISMPVVTAALKKDFVTPSSNYTQAISTRWSDIVSLGLINPETGALVKVNLTANDSKLAVSIPVFGVSSTNEAECRQWVNQTWTKDTCSNSDPILIHSVQHVVCYCSQMTFTGVFQGPLKPAALTVQVVQQSAAAAQSESDSSSNSTNPFLAGISNSTTTTTVAPQKVQPNQSNNSNATSGGTVNATPNLVHLAAARVQFSFSDDFNKVVGSDPASFIRSVTQQISTALEMDVSRIVDVEAKAGSIIIALTLTKGNTSGINASLANLENKVKTGSLVVMRADGTVMPVNTTSWMVISYSPTIGMVATTTASAPPVEKSQSGSDDKMGLIIGAAVGGGLLLILVIVLAVICCKKPPKQVYPNDSDYDSPRGYQTPPPPSGKPESPKRQQLYPKISDKQPAPPPQDPSFLKADHDPGKPAGRLSPLMPRDQMAAKPGTPISSSMTDLG